jgi:hypothetical protein
MLNPGMKGEGHYEWMRQRAEAIKEQHKPQPTKPALAPGSMEWLAEQNKSS